MSPELQNKLINTYPKQFQNIKHIECEDGWYDLLDKLFYIVQMQLDKNTKLNQSDSFFSWNQIKEKFGGLRAYSYGADDYIRGAIELAESMSYTICEFSGEKGKLRKQRLGDNGEPIFAWRKTLSDKEAEKDGYL